MHRLVNELGRIISEQSRGGWIHKGGDTGTVHAINAFSRLSQDDFVQMAEAVQNLLGAPALSDVTDDAAVKHRVAGLPSGQ